MSVRRQSILEFAVFATLVWVGVALRWRFAYIPNFAPVAAIALFAGFFFRSPLVGIAAPLSVMFISDIRLGGYHPILMVTVYTMLALPVIARPYLQRRLLVKSTGWRKSVASVLALIGCAVAASLAFFVATNFVTWAVSGMYERSLAGLAHCYIQAIPFLRYTLAGDLGFATVLFSGYALASNLASSPQAEALVTG